ncbi:hypothetical protein ACMT9U_11370 [Clavibacter sp. Sh2036]|uniref:hypothetical protein n=1 Tax=Clavibacter sp. Sh2036 TaxID=3397677 RepID=UPI0039DF42A3
MTTDPTIPDLASVPNALALEEAARAFDSIGPAVDDAMHTVTSSWAGLSSPGVFETPDSGRLADSLVGATAVARTVGEDSSAAKAALMAYAREVQDLSGRHAVISADVAAQFLTVSDPVQFDRQPPNTSAADPHKQLETLITQFNSDLEDADARCAKALQHLLRYPGDVAVHAAQVAGEAASLPGVGLLLDTTAEALKDPAGPRDAFLGLTDMLGMTTPRGAHAGTEIGSAESTASAPVTQAAASAIAADDAVKGAGAGAHLAERSRFSILGAKAAGSVLSVAASTIDGAASAANTYEKDEAAHPDWDDMRRQAHAARSGEVTAAFDFAAGAGETAIGAGIGTLICPGIGTVIGGIIGGVGGGLLFSDAVDHASDTANSFIDANTGE